MVNEVKKINVNYEIINEIQIVDDTYNASLDSVKNSLELLSKVDDRKVFILIVLLKWEGGKYE